MLIPTVSFIGCANGHIVEGLTEKYLFCLVLMKKSFYLQQSHVIMQMSDSLIILLLGSSFGFTITLYKTKCQPLALRDEHMCPVQ